MGPPRCREPALLGVRWPVAPVPAQGRIRCRKRIKIRSKGAVMRSNLAAYTLGLSDRQKHSVKYPATSRATVSSSSLPMRHPELQSRGA
jgi:hypothetical protein